MDIQEVSNKKQTTDLKQTSKLQALKVQTGYPVKPTKRYDLEDRTLRRAIEDPQFHHRQI
jgi:hypothetical protein